MNFSTFILVKNATKYTQRVEKHSDSMGNHLTSGHLRKMGVLKREDTQNGGEEIINDSLGTFQTQEL